MLALIILMNALLLYCFLCHVLLFFVHVHLPNDWVGRITLGRLDDRDWFEGLNRLSPQPLKTPLSIYLLSREDVWSRKPRC